MAKVKSDFWWETLAGKEVSRVSCGATLGSNKKDAPRLFLRRDPKVAQKLTEWGTILRDRTHFLNSKNGVVNEESCSNGVQVHFGETSHSNNKFTSACYRVHA